MENSPRISFCTACMSSDKGNYFEYLKKTLPRNMEDTKDYPGAQFVVLNYGTTEHTQRIADWIRDEFQGDIASGRLKYVAFPEATTFRMAHAKNMAHRVADGDILCNVDADQYIGAGFAQFVADEFAKAQERGVSIYMRHSNADTSAAGSRHDSMGKIVVRKDDFLKLRGYNEKFEGWECEDGEFTMGMRLKGINPVTIPLSYGDSIAHDSEQRLVNLSEEARERSAATMKGWEGGVIRRAIHAVGRRAERVRSNVMEVKNPEGFGMGEVFVNFSDSPEQLGPLQEPKKTRGI